MGLYAYPGSLRDESSKTAWQLDPYGVESKPNFAEGDHYQSLVLGRFHLQNLERQLQSR